ncbi:uncharacterized protein LOC127861585 isoform X2 [Dreissena polymorpha]|uniref:Apple domain-containing protein n=2 Tax=Dreissena polymorpha TaxID=45954 RepID=A0A9D4BA84_DREPO|nr:uncharacterized protein LOC127861585 isoform X2 [Dreissena polymorpha]KAH3695076.1 hypothetical protein DPMN_082528 [Dreissena polymorpha]
MWRLLIFAVCVWMVVGQGPSTPPPPFKYGQFCAPRNTTMLASYLQGNGTVLPPMPTFPDEFQVRVEANIIEKNMTIVGEEFYDKGNNRAALRTITNNSEDYMIFDYNNDQLIYDVNGVCYATDLKYDDNQLLFGMQMTGAGIPHIYNTAQTLHFAAANGLTYMGRQVIRGILCDWWRSCMYWDILASNFTLDYFFTAQDTSFTWTEPDNENVVPIRAEIQGTQYIPQINGANSKNFHHIYEYFDFRNAIWAPDDKFWPPRGVQCSGRKDPKPVPQLTSQYSYREEIVDSINSAVSQADIYYDFSYQLVRFDYRPSSAGYPYYTTNPVTEIHDYNTGIAYAIDKTQGNCSMIPIQNASFDASVNVTGTSSGFYIRMKSPSQLFYLDNTTYSYEGQRTVRGMLCDVYISKRTDFTLPYIPWNFTSTFEFYFLSNSWTQQNNIGKTAILQNTPVQLVISTPDSVAYQATYNIYNWVPEDPSFNRFDVTSCYDTNSQQSFILEWPGSWDSSIAQYQNQFVRAVTQTIVRLAHVNPIRVQKPTFKFDPTNIYFVATLLDAPPPMAYFTKMSNSYQQTTNDATLSVTSPDDCARACNTGSNLTGSCMSFDFCLSNSVCALSTTHAQKGQIVGTATCDHYDRTVDYQSLSIPLAKVWTTLKNSVLIGDFQFSLPINGQNVQFTAGAIDNNVIQNAQRQLSSQALMDQFVQQINKDIPGYDDLIITGVAIDDCATGCLSQQSWVCNSFSYCFDTGYCILSKLHPDARPSAVVNKPLCDLYSKKYTVDYQLVQGKTVLSSTDTIYQNIYSADQCGQLCSNYNGFNCKSFDYCDGISTCFLGKTHYFDVPQSDVQDSPMCDHYSRKYISDFKQTSRQKLLNQANRIIQNIPVDQCAKLCVEQEGASCASFGYCGNTSECRLSTASMRNVGQVSSEPNLYCDIYNRQSFPDGTPYINNPQKYFGSQQSTGYSGGSMAGLAFGMIILGIVIAIGVFFGFQKFKGTPNDGMSVHFVKNESES